jgi:hypothetical protein
MKKLVTTICCFAASIAFAGPELVSPSNLTIDFGASVLAGTGRQIKIMNVPVVNSSIGTATTYYNADLDFQFLADGRLAAVLTNASVATGPALAPTSSTTNFNPGTYKETQSSCLYTLFAGGIGTDGARAYIMSVNTVSCLLFPNQNIGIAATYSFSTAPAATNPYMTQGSFTTSQYPTVSGSFGTSSFVRNVRLVAAGTAISITGYSEYTGLSNGNTYSFIKQ